MNAFTAIPPLPANQFLAEQRLAYEAHFWGMLALAAIGVALAVGAVMWLSQNQSELCEALAAAEQRATDAERQQEVAEQAAVAAVAAVLAAQSTPAPTIATPRKPRATRKPVQSTEAGE
jgi:hypothetical protein